MDVFWFIDQTRFYVEAVVITLFLVLFTSFWWFKLSPGRSLDDFKGTLVGHRGLMRHTLVPENTIPAFKLAVKNGVTVIELDVRLTADHVAVVFHDTTVNRVMEAEGRVRDMTFEELSKLNYKGYDTSIRVPSLEQVLEFAKEENLKLYIEVKGFDTYALDEIIVGLLHKHDFVDSVVVIAFDPWALYHIRKLDPTIRTGFLFEEGLLPLSSLFERLGLTALLLWLASNLIPVFLGSSMVGPSVDFASIDYVKAQHKAGRLVYIWTSDCSNCCLKYRSLHTSVAVNGPFN